MSLVRSGSLVLVLSASLFSLACSSTPAAESAKGTTAEQQGESSSALVLSKVDDAAKLDVKSSDGACTPVSTLVETKKDELKTLCAEGQIPVPVLKSADGCEAGSVIEISFECHAVHFPPMPQNGCIDLSVKDNGEMPDGTELDTNLVCPRLGGAPPPPFGQDPTSGQQGQGQNAPQQGPNAGQNGQPPFPGPNAGQNGQPPFPGPNAGQNGQPPFPGPNAGQNGQPGQQPGGSCGAGSAAGGQQGQPPMPAGGPKIRCCAPTSGG